MSVHEPILYAQTPEEAGSSEEPEIQAETEEENSAQEEAGGSEKTAEQEGTAQQEETAQGGIDVSAPSAVLVEASTGQVIYEKDADTQR